MTRFPWGVRFQVPAHSHEAVFCWLGFLFASFLFTRLFSFSAVGVFFPRMASVKIATAVLFLGISKCQAAGKLWGPLSGWGRPSLSSGKLVGSRGAHTHSGDEKAEAPVNEVRR